MAANGDSEEVQELREEVARLRVEVKELRDAMRRHALGLIKMLDKTSKTETSTASN